MQMARDCNKTKTPVPRGAGEAREVRAGEAQEILEAEEAREEAEEAIEKVVKWNGDSGRQGVVRRQGRHPPNMLFTEFVTRRTRRLP